jgi:LCP family protein required for cell wall assembly
MLSIPRDLWVNIPDFGQNRINAAHFFAESDQPGSGSIVTLETIHQNFGIDVNYFVRIRFDGLINIVDALGGLDIELEEQMAGYPPGDYHLDGEKVLAFVRDRQGTDDFFRMQQGQFFLKEAWEQLVQPRGLIRFPALMAAVTTTVDTNLPLWLWPRLGLAFLRAGSRGIDSRVISREMVTPFTTSEGAQVLMPDWDKITPVLLAMFGQ